LPALLICLLLSLNYCRWSGSDSQSFLQVFHHLTAEQVNTTGLLNYLVLLKHHKHNINENSSNLVNPEFSIYCFHTNGTLIRKPNCTCQKDKCKFMVHIKLNFGELCMAAIIIKGV